MGAIRRSFAAWFGVVVAALALAGCGGGGGGGASTPAAGTNSAPVAALITSGDIRMDAGQIHASIGGTVRLDGSTSTDAESDALSFAWTLAAGPASSNAPARASGPSLSWQPNALGTYTYALTVSDPKGGSTSKNVSILVDNSAPTANLLTSVQFTPVPVQVAPQAVTLGANVIVDGSGATDPDGDPVTLAFTLVARPANSTSALTITGKTARFTPDALGTYQVRTQGTDPSGSSFETVHTFNASNRAPTAVQVVSVSPVLLDAGQGTVVTSVGYDVLLDGTTSSDPDGDTLTKAWELVSRPAGSSATLGASSGNSTGLAPDLLGDYVVALTVTDTQGAKSKYTTTVRANNRRPVAQVTTNATPQALPAATTQLMPAGTEITLRGDISVDADGDALAYAWFVDARPAGSSAQLSSATAQNPKITLDADGVYVFRLRVTDPAGAFSERSLTVPVGTHSPVAVADRTQVTALVGTQVQSSASLSFDEDGDVLSYQWSIDARPAGSVAGLAVATQATASFVPDLPGTYVLAVRVSDGKTSSAAFVTVKVLAQVQSAVALNFAPGEARYSTGLDKLVVGSVNPNALRVVDPFTGAMASVALPAIAQRINLSPDGKLAAVLHDGAFSLVDLQAVQLLRTTASGGAHTDAFVTNDGIVYLIGNAGGQFSPEGVVVFNGKTGERIAQPTFGGSATFYGTQRGILAGSLNKVFFVSEGLSPTDISYFGFAPATSTVTGSGDSPYHGDYLMGSPLYLAGDEGLLFTMYGTYFRTGDLRYAGQLQGLTNLHGLSHSASRQEALVLQGMPSSANQYPFPPDYPAAYKRYTGSLLVPDTDLALPKINGAQAYGMKIFHSGNGSHVVIVQTGSPAQSATGVAYYVIVR